MNIVPLYHRLDLAKSGTLLKQETITAGLEYIKLSDQQFFVNDTGLKNCIKYVNDIASKCSLQIVLKWITTYRLQFLHAYNAII